MKDKIINASIESLRHEGLKFSIDTLANKLKISKKTIYKFFPDKETLALSLYEKYYNDAKKQAKLLLDTNEESSSLNLLYLYFDSKTMMRKDIFNKYQLNDRIFSYVTEQNDSLWEMISKSFCNRDSKKDVDIFRIIVDGSFEKICNEQLDYDAVIERLVHLL